MNTPVFSLHCVPCQVGWNSSEGETCWNCPRPGTRGRLPDLATPHGGTSNPPPTILTAQTGAPA